MIGAGHAGQPAGALFAAALGLIGPPTSAVVLSGSQVTFRVRAPFAYRLGRRYERVTLRFEDDGLGPPAKVGKCDAVPIASGEMPNQQLGCLHLGRWR